MLGWIGWILWGLLGLLLLLFFCKTRIELLYLDGTVTVRLRLLHLLGLTVYPIPKGKKKHGGKEKPAKTKKEKPQAEKPVKPKKPLPVMDIIQTVNDMLPIFGRSIGYWLRHITINRLWVRAVIHEEDAADTAIRCGQLSAASQTLYAWCSTRMRIKDFSMNAVPSFTDAGQPLNICLHVSASPAALVWGSVLFLCRGGVALWRGPIVAQMRRKQPKATPRDDNKNKRRATKKLTQQ